MAGWHRLIHFFTKGVRDRRLLFTVLGLLFLVLAADSTKILEGSKDPLRSRSDFDDYYQAARRLRSGEDLYLMNQMDRILQQAPNLTSMKPEELLRLLQESRGVGAYLYPPFFAWTLGPLSLMEYRSAAIVFQLLSLCSLAASLILLIREAGFLAGAYQSSRSPAMIVAVTVLYFGFLAENVSNGNAGFFIMALCTAGILFSFREKGKDGAWTNFLGGFLIGLATAIKIIPGFLSGVLFAGRRWYALAGFLAGLAFAVLAPAVTLGWDANLARHLDWYHLLIHNYGALSVVRPYANNQTISAALSKLFVAGSDFRQAAYGLPLVIGAEKEMLPLIALVIRLLNLFFVGSLGMLLVGVSMRGSVKGLADANLGRLLSLTLLTALVTSGVSWYHTYAILVLPLSLRLVLPRPLSGPERFSFLAPAILGLILSVIPGIVSRGASLYSLYVWAALGAILLHHLEAWKGLLSGTDKREGAQ